MIYCLEGIVDFPKTCNFFNIFALKFNSVKCLKYFCQNNFEMPTEHELNLDSSTNIESIKILVEHGLQITNILIIHCFNFLNSDIINYLFEHTNQLCRNNAIGAIVTTIGIKALTKLDIKYQCFNEEHLFNLIKKNYHMAYRRNKHICNNDVVIPEDKENMLFEVFVHIYEKIKDRLNHTEKYTEAVVKNMKNTKFTKFILKNKFPIYDNIIHDAIESRNFLKFRLIHEHILQNKDVTWDEDTYIRIISIRNIKFVKYICNHDPNLPTMLINDNILKHAICILYSAKKQTTFRYSQVVFDYLVKTGFIHDKEFIWLLLKTDSFSSETVKLFKNQKIAIFKHFTRKEFVDTEMLKYAVENCNYEYTNHLIFLIGNSDINFCELIKIGIRNNRNMTLINLLSKHKNMPCCGDLLDFATGNDELREKKELSL